MGTVKTINIGIDIGQKIDPTAVAVVELVPRQTGTAPTESHFVARYLERLPLGAPYPRIAERLGEIIRGVDRQFPPPFAPDPFAPAVQKRDPEITVQAWADATGVGQPVVDLLSAAGVPVRACYFTHGDRRTREPNQVNIGKGWLVSRLKTLFQTGRIHLPRTGEAMALEQELLDYEIRVTEDANERYGAFKIGAHDDLVTALGLATQEDGTGGIDAIADDLIKAFSWVTRAS